MSSFSLSWMVLLMVVLALLLILLFVLFVWPLRLGRKQRQQRGFDVIEKDQDPPRF